VGILRQEGSGLHVPPLRPGLRGAGQDCHHRSKKERGLEVKVSDFIEHFQRDLRKAIVTLEIKTVKAESLRRRTHDAASALAAEARVLAMKEALHEVRSRLSVYLDHRG